jgi:UDP-N-acetyl-D-galactosamine dehydrogenase
MGARVLILGIAFKEDVPDVRNTRVIDIVKELRRYGSEPVVCDPIVDAAAVEREYDLATVPMVPLPSADAVIVAVPHRIVRAIDPKTLAAAIGPGAPCLDLKGVLDRSALTAVGLVVWTL